MTLILLACFMIANTPEAFADCKHKEKTCNCSRKHASKYVGVYYRSDVININAQNLPVITLNEDGTAIIYFGEALFDYISSGTSSPEYGNWKPIGNHQILVMTLGYSAIETSTENSFSAVRSTMILDFSKSLNSPTIIAQALVSLAGVLPAFYFDPNAGTVLFNNPIPPRALKRICAFATDLERTN